MGDHEIIALFFERSEQAILEHLDQPDLWHNEDGTVWISYRGEKIKITEEWYGNKSPCIGSALGVRRDNGTLK